MKMKSVLVDFFVGADIKARLRAVEAALNDKFLNGTESVGSEVEEKR